MMIRENGKIEIVQFKDGRYGVRRLDILGRYEFKDLRSSRYFWWQMDTRYFEDCRGTLEEAKKALYFSADTGVPVNLNEKKLEGELPKIPPKPRKWWKIKWLCRREKVKESS